MAQYRNMLVFTQRVRIKLQEPVRTTKSLARIQTLMSQIDIIYSTEQNHSLTDSYTIHMVGCMCQYGIYQPHANWAFCLLSAASGTTSRAPDQFPCQSQNALNQASSGLLLPNLLDIGKTHLLLLTHLSNDRNIFITLTAMYNFRKRTINLLKPTGYMMHQQD